jgi:hypothetical protein
MSEKRKAIMIYMDESDLVALADVRKRLGATTNSGAIRAALRIVADVPIPRKKRKGKGN